MLTIYFVIVKNSKDNTHSSLFTKRIYLSLDHWTKVYSKLNQSNKYQIIVIKNEEINKLKNKDKQSIKERIDRRESINRGQLLAGFVQTSMLPKYLNATQKTD